METRNPVLSQKRLRRLVHLPMEACTLDGTIHKSGLLLLITVATAAFAWGTGGSTLAQYLYPVAIVAAVVGLGIAIALAFKPEWAPICAPAYAAVEGVFLGAISKVMEEAYPGIVLESVLLTFGVAALMLALYRTQAVKVTKKFRTVVILATLSVALVYLVTFLLSLAGVAIPYLHEGGALGIVFSLVVVTIAALNLLLDFDAIERAVKERMPQFMEWFFGFALLVTIVWLYLEILRLLAQVRGKD